MPLASWRNSAPRVAGLRLKIGMSFLLIASVSTFAFLLLRPFSRAEMQVLIVGPSGLGQITLADANDIDLPLLLSVANAKQVENAILGMHAPMLLRQNDRKSFALSLQQIEANVPLRVKRHSTLVVYVAGVLSVDNSEPSLCDNSRDAVHSGITMEPIRLIHMLQGLRCHRVLLCIDAATPISKGPSQVASSVAWKNLCTKVEKQLLKGGNSPIAVQLGLNTIGSTRPACNISPLASKLASYFSLDIPSVGRNLFDLQQLLSASDSPDPKRGYLSLNSRWLVSADWPMESVASQLPALLNTRAKDNATTSSGPVTTSLTTASTLSINEADETEFAATIASASTQELFSICDSIFAKWRRSKNPTGPLPLSIPPRLARQHSHRFAFHNMLTGYTKLRSATLLVPSSVDNLQIRRFTESLECLDRDRPVPNHFPLWIRRLPETFPIAINTLSQSLIVNAMLESLGHLQYPVDYSGDSVLQELSKQVMGNAVGSAADLAAWIKQLPDASHGYLEVEWAKEVLSHADVPWELQKAFIQAKMLATRLACDPLTIEWGIECLKSGDVSRVNAERTLSDLARSDWAMEAETEVQAAISKLHQGLERIDSVRKRQQENEDETIENPIQSFKRYDETVPPTKSSDESEAFAENAKPELLMTHVANSKQKFRDCVQLNLDRLGHERFGTTSRELEKLEKQLGWWSDIATSFCPTVGFPTKSTLSLVGANSLDLTASQSIESSIEIQSSQSHGLPIQLQAQFDAHAAEVRIDGKIVTLDRPLTFPMNANKESQLRVGIAVQRRQGQSLSKPLVLVATRGNEQRRTVIALNTPREPMVHVEFENFHCSMDMKPISVPFSALFPNQVNAISISLTNRTATTRFFSSRLLYLEDCDAFPPSGSVSTEEAEHWLHRVGQPIVLAVSSQMQLATGQRNAVGLASVPWPSDQAKPIFKKLYLETRDESTGQVQIEQWTPRVVHPKQYVQPTVVYDAARQSLQVHTQLIPSAPTSLLGTSLDIELSDLPQLQVVSRATVQLHPGRREVRTLLSTAACRTDRALLCFAIDNWKSSFVYEIDLRRSGNYETTKQFAAIRLQLADPRNTVAPQNENVEVQVETIMNEDCFDEIRDSIEVGFDRNGNRSLDDDVTMRVDGTRSRRFEWSGVVANGSFAIRAVADSHHVKIPVQLEWNRWVPAMAVLRRSGEFIPSNSVLCVFDRVPPKIESIRIVGPQPAVLGLPLSVDVQISDDGLSGVASAEAGWSTNGELEFVEQTKSISAIYRDRDRWLLTVPTDTMPSGWSTLLIRCQDRAGKLSKTYSVRVEMLRPEEIESRTAKLKTIIRGDTMFGLAPQGGITVRLLKEPVEKSVDKLTEQTKDLVARTDSDGRFVMEQVSAGKYSVEFSGIVQGMRIKRTQEVVVNPLNGPLEIHMRLDQKQ